MELKDVVGVGQAGLTAVLEEVEKVRDAGSDRAQARADEMRSEFERVREAGAERAHNRADEVRAAIDEMRARADNVIAELPAVKQDLKAMATALTTPAVKSGRKAGRALVVLAVVGATAGAGYLVWRRRQESIRDQLSGESPWSAPAVVPETYERGVADVDSPDVVDEEFAEEIDAAADELAEEIVDSIDVPGEAQDQPAEDAVEDQDRPAEGSDENAGDPAPETEK